MLLRPPRRRPWDGTRGTRWAGKAGGRVQTRPRSGKPRTRSERPAWQQQATGASASATQCACAQMCKGTCAHVHARSLRGIARARSHGQSVLCSSRNTTLGDADALACEQHACRRRFMDVRSARGGSGPAGALWKVPRGNERPESIHPLPGAGAGLVHDLGQLHMRGRGRQQWKPTSGKWGASA